MLLEAWAFHSHNPGAREGRSVLAAWGGAGPGPRRHFPGLLPRLQVPKTTPSPPTGACAEQGVLLSPRQHASQGGGSISTKTHRMDEFTSLRLRCAGRSYDLNPGSSASRPSRPAVPRCPLVYTGEVDKDPIQFKNRDCSSIAQGSGAKREQRQEPCLSGHPRSRRPGLILPAALLTSNVVPPPQSHQQVSNFPDVGLVPPTNGYKSGVLIICLGPLIC